jgi:transposase
VPVRQATRRGAGEVPGDLHPPSKYGCALCKEGVSQAPAPAHLLEARAPSEALLAHVSVTKYADDLPFYRQEGIHALDSVEISRNTMANWMGHVRCASGAARYALWR